MRLTHDLDLTKHSGFLPVILKGKKSGYEFYFISTEELKPNLSQLNIDKVKFKEAVAFQFKWGGNFVEAASAFYSALIVSTKFNGIVFDPQEGQYLNVEQLKQDAEFFYNKSEKEG